jgi:hypothetical protein
MKTFDPNFEEPDLCINGYTLQQTSIACPEQYDVIDSNGEMMGYLRLRHGYFRADYPTCGGETVYESNTKGDGLFDDDERIPELTKAVAALDAAHRNKEKV